jgi:hypothetical protein
MVSRLTSGNERNARSRPSSRLSLSIPSACTGKKCNSVSRRVADNNRRSVVRIDSRDILKHYVMCTPVHDASLYPFAPNSRGKKKIWVFNNGKTIPNHCSKVCVRTAFDVSDLSQHLSRTTAALSMRVTSR